MLTNNTGAVIIEGHVQGLSNTRALGEAGIPVYVVDKNSCIARYSKYCKKFFICPDYQTDEFADFLISLALNENISGWVLIPSNDHAVHTISRHRETLCRHYKVITPEISIIENIYDKRKLLEKASACGIPVPKTQYFSSPDEAMIAGLQFPVITKGRNGLSFYKATGKKAFLSVDESELRSHLKIIDKKYNIAGSFTQELIPFDGTNKTISFTAFCEYGEIKAYWMGVKLREHPLKFGTATYAKSTFIETCYHQSVPLLRMLNYTGVCEVEYIFDPRDKQYKLIEINARTWLWVGLARACGIDYANMIYCFTNNIPVHYPAKYKLGIGWINPFSDFFFSVKAMLTFRLRPSQYFNSIFETEKVNALAYPGDNKPLYSYLVSLFSFIKNR